MGYDNYTTVVEVTRGPIVESVHFGAAAVVDSSGTLIASVGDTNTVSYLRSSAKPFQALPLIESGGADHFGLTDEEIAVTCASHKGTDEHYRVISSIQRKIGVSEADLMCGVHDPGHKPTTQAMWQRGEVSTPIRHNCSGKHTGMLAVARFMGYPTENYIDPGHPVQCANLQTVAEMCGVAPEEVILGTDGCSVPVFAVPLYNCAFGLARLCDPVDLTLVRSAACRRVTRAMMAYPDMVSGPEGFDTVLMQHGGGRIVSKGGAEGYQVVGVMPGALGEGSPGLGIAVKIADGDPTGRARTVVMLEILRSLGVLSADELRALPIIGSYAVTNWRKLIVGEMRPVFELVRGAA
jgi:L-asparaginase II